MVHKWPKNECGWILVSNRLTLFCSTRRGSHLVIFHPQEEHDGSYIHPSAKADQIAQMFDILTS